MTQPVQSSPETALLNQESGLLDTKAEILELNSKNQSPREVKIRTDSDSVLKTVLRKRSSAAGNDSDIASSNYDTNSQIEFLQGST